MRMLDHICPRCGKKAFEADGSVPMRIHWKCPRCDFVGPPVPRNHETPIHQTLRCSKCGRIQHLERPVADRTYCIVCGTPTLAVIAETRPGEAREQGPPPKKIGVRAR